MLLAIGGLVFTFVTFMVEAEDRRSERVFRAWEIVLSVSSGNEDAPIGSGAGSAVRQALEYLNRDFEGWFCRDFIQNIAHKMIGSDTRCFSPRKRRESLANLHLKNIDLDHVFLQNAILNGSRFDGVSFHHAKLKNADLNNIYANKVPFFKADLQLAKLYGAELSGAFLYCANLSEAELGGADLSGILGGPYDAHSWLDDLGLQNCDMGPYALDLSQADLRGAIFVDANLAFANLEKARFGAADLKDTDLYGANVSNAKMSKVKNLTPNQLDAACALEGQPPILSEEYKKYKWSNTIAQRNQCAYLDQ